MGSPDWHSQRWTSTLKNSCGCTALDMPEWKEMTEHVCCGQSNQWKWLALDMPEWKEMTEHVCCGQSNQWKWLASQKSEVFRSLRRYLQAQCQGHHNHWSPGGERCGKRKRSITFLEKMRKGCHQSDEHWNCFKLGNVGEASERQGGTHVGFPKCIDTILNWTDSVWNRMTSRVLMHNQQGQGFFFLGGGGGALYSLYWK